MRNGEVAPTKASMIINLFNIENLVLRSRSEFNGFAGKDEERFWSTGVLEYWKKSKPEFQLELVLALLHHSTTPLLQNTI
jgi:hypothetical protein